MCLPTRKKIITLFDELEFKTLRQRVLGVGQAAPSVTSSPKAKAAEKKGQLDLFEILMKSSASNPAQISEGLSDVEGEDTLSHLPKRTIADTPHRYHTVDTPELMTSLSHYLSLQDAFCFDTETTSLDTIDAELVGLSFHTLLVKLFTFRFLPDKVKAQEIIEHFRGVFENEAIEKIGQNIKYDLLVLKNYNIEVRGKLSDTMLAHYLLEPDKRHGMDILAEAFLNYARYPSLH